MQPYYVAGKDFYAMLLSCRNSSNTAVPILLPFIPLYSVKKHKWLVA